MLYESLAQTHPEIITAAGYTGCIDLIKAHAEKLENPEPSTFSRMFRRGDSNDHLLLKYAKECVARNAVLFWTASDVRALVAIIESDRLADSMITITSYGIDYAPEDLVKYIAANNAVLLDYNLNGQRDDYYGIIQRAIDNGGITRKHIDAVQAALEYYAIDPMDEDNHIR